MIRYLSLAEVLTLHRLIIDWLRDLLDSEDVPLTLAHAKFVKAIAYAKVKTDTVDALTLAQLLRADLIPVAHMVSPELRPLRDLLRTRLHLVEKRTSAKNSVERLLEKYQDEVASTVATEGSGSHWK